MAACFFFLFSSFIQPAFAQEPPKREIMVPFEDLNVLLEGQPRRVLLTRQEYADLLAAAKKQPGGEDRQPAAVVAAEYAITIGRERAEISGTLTIDSPALSVNAEGDQPAAPFLHALGLDLAGVGLRSAKLGEQDAAIGIAPDGRPMLFVAGDGRQTLKLDLVAPVETSAALQMLNLQLPTPSAARVTATVPGNVEIKSGAAVVQRTYDEAANVTRFELLPVRGQMSLVMTLNNRQQRTERVVVARSVLVDEVTAAYERLHATVSFAVLHQPVDSFRLVVPQGFEVTTVSSPLVARWAADADGNRQVLDVRLREATNETVVLTISAIRTPPVFAGWTLPRLEPLDVAGHVSVVGLLAEDRWQVDSLVPTGLIPIDNATLVQALPESVFQAEPGAPRVRPVAAYYAPQGAFSLTATFQETPARLRVSSNVLLMVGDSGLLAHGGFAIKSEAEALFGFEFSVPAGWKVLSVSAADGSAIPFEAYAGEAGASRVRARLPAPLKIGTEATYFFYAESTPAGWLGEWREQQFAFPVFAVQGAASDNGALAVAIRDDLNVRPGELTNVIPLDDAEKVKFGLTDATRLAYRYESHPYSAAIIAERTVPRITARTYAFFRLLPEALEAHYELHFDVQEARARRLQFKLPASTPTALDVQGLDGAALKEFSSTDDGDTRLWTATLADARRGLIRLRVTFRDSFAEDAAEKLSLPMIVAEGVEYQSGFVAVEGHADLEVEATAHADAVDIGELADADYQPGRRLVGAYGFVGQPVATTLKVARRDGLPLPAAIVEKAELVTVLSDQGVSQSVARFFLRTKTSFLEARLPAGSTLWSADLDGQPIKPQRQGDSLLVSLPTMNEGALRDLRIVYETPVGAAGFSGDVSLVAPKLLLRAALDATGTEVPLADLVWHVFTPSGYRVVRADGTVVTAQLPPQRLAATNVAIGLYKALGGVQPGYWLGSVQSARESGIKTKSEPSAGFRYSDTYDAAPTAETPAPRGPDQPKRPTKMNLDNLADEPMAGEDDAMRREATKDFDALPMDEMRDIEQMVPPQPQDAPQEEQPPMAAPEGDKKKKAEEGRPQDPNQAAFESHDTATTSGRDAKTRIWAMEGVRSLKIDLASAGEGMRFHSLGTDPQVELTMANSSRLKSLAAGLALLIVLLGVAKTWQPVGVKVRYVLLVGLAATLIPLVVGGETLTYLANAVFYGAAVTALIYCIAGIVCWFCTCCCRVCCRVTPVTLDGAKTSTTAVAILLALLCGAPSAHAQEAGLPMPVVVQVIPPPPPVVVPDDVLIVPYDPDKAVEAQQVLIPFQQFADLWNRAYPDLQLIKQPPPAPYALAGGAYSATLSGDEYLVVEGRLELDIFADGFVTVPLPLTGGVLAKADLDGKPAKLGVVAGDAPIPQNVAPNQQAPNAAAAAPGQSLLVLYATGKGRHRLDLAVRIKLERRGGWRVATGFIPSAPASSLKLRVPEAGTEIRLQGVRDRGSYETEAADETIDTALSHDQTLSIQWRPKVAEGVVDRGLTVQSSAVATVQEDGVRLVWKLKLEFRRGLRDGFTLTAPAGYLVERVVGQNVRGWEAKPADPGQRLEVTLLKPARDEENLVVYLWRAGAPGVGDMATLDIPQVGVEGAQLHAGQVTIHRSPLLELRTVETTGVSRTDLSAEGAAEASATGLEESPLGNRPFAAFRFSTVPFTVRLAVEQVKARVAAEFQTLLRIAERQRTLETRLLLRVDNRPLYSVRIAIPADLEIDGVTAPGSPEWGVTEEAGRRVLAVRLAAGQIGEFAILIRGTLGSIGPIDTLPLPKFEVLEIDRQESYIVVQPDPAFAVSAVNLQNCETVLASRVEAWMGMVQRRLAQLNIYARDAGYSGELQIAPRQPVVTCNTFTNVRVTSRTIEETVLLDFNVRDAGIREVVFLLPPWMKRARIQAPLERQKTITPSGDGAEAPLRVRLQLQDEVMGQYRVLIENDRLLTDEAQESPIPVIETGRTERQFVAFESAGRSEVVIERQDGLSPLGRQQQDWRTAAAVLGDRLTQAYQVEPDAKSPRLTFRTQQRQAVETVGARIGLAQCVLTLDDHGAYRAAQIYRLNNSTEQYLELELPAGAELWTARVDGQPVKPVVVPKSANHVRIPLLKTTLGDTDYEVAVKYGGVLPRPGALSHVKFPFIRTVNISVEQSQVRLFLPEKQHWFDFGGSMRKVESDADLAAGWLSYQNKQLQELIAATKVDSSYARVRAASNLKQLSLGSHGFHDVNDQLPAARLNPELQQEVAGNTALVQEANEQIMIVEQEPAQTVIDNNSVRLNDYFNAQEQSRSKNVANDLGRNFDDSQVQQQAAREDKSGDGQQAGKPGMGGGGGKAGGRFNAKWLEGNKLGAESQAPAKSPGRSRVVQQDDEAPAVERGESKPNAGQPQNPRFAQEDVQKQINESEKSGQQSQGKGQGQSEGQTLDNYRSKVAKQQMRQPAQQAAPNGDPNAQPQTADPAGQPSDRTLPSANYMKDDVQYNPPPVAGVPFDRRMSGVNGPGPGVMAGQPGGGPIAFAPDGQAVANGRDAGIILDNSGSMTFTGLASLDVQIPQRGVEYRFTTPRGDVEITARAVSTSFSDRLTKLAVLAAALLVLWFVWRKIGGAVLAFMASRHATTVLIVLSLVSIVFGIFPVAGLLGLIAGIAIKLRRRFMPTAVAMPA